MRKKLLVFGLAALVLLAALLPVLHSAASARGGRVFKYTVVMSAQKDPPDDPWSATPVHMFFLNDPNVLQSELSLWATPSLSSGSVTTFIAKHPSLPMLSTVRIVTTFSYSSTTTATVFFVTAGYGVIFIPSRTYTGGETYRWIVQYSAYDTPTLKVMPFAIPTTAGPSGSIWVIRGGPLTALCTYVSPTQGSGSLPVSTGFSHFNNTHVRVTYTLTIPNGWSGRAVSECTVYTTSPQILNAVNSRLNANLDQLWLLYVAPNVTVYDGDMIVVEVWVVAPANL